MCEICHRTPCDPRCPNSEGPRVVFTCSNCDGDIHEGDDVWNINGEPWCEECIDNAHEHAEWEDEW